MTMTRLPIAACLAAAFIILGSSACRADLSFTVSLDTSSLSAANGPYYLDFQLNDGGGGPAAGNNTAMITNLSGYQGLDPALPNYGLGVSGGFTSPGDTLTITDQVDPTPPVPGTGGINEYTQGFTPGSTLSFHVALTTNVDPGGSPDQFLFSIFYTDPDNGPQYIPTTSLLGFSFVSVSIDSTSPTIGAYGSDSSTAPTGIDMAAPEIKPDITAVPEPPSSLLVVGTWTVLGLRSWWARRRDR